MLRERKINMNKMETFNALLAYFQELELNLDIRQMDNYNHKFDYGIEVNGHDLNVFIKNEVRPDTLSLMDSVFDTENNVLLAAAYITPKAKTALKDKRVNYIDGFGNAYIDLENLKIYVEKGNAKPIVNTKNEIFTLTGAKVLFELLQNPESINTNTYREWADKCGIALGSVSKVLNALTNEGFLIKVNNTEKQLIRREELLQRWIPLINEKVLPTYFIDTYQFGKTSQGEWKNIEDNMHWAGEPAAALLTNYINPEEFSLFTNLDKTEIIKKAGLLPNKNGNINIFKPFWKVEDSDFSTVPPLLIYAQLMYNGNSRNIETAKLIYDEFLKAKL